MEGHSRLGFFDVLRAQQALFGVGALIVPCALIEGLGFRVSGLGFGVHGLRFRVEC